MNFDTFSRSHFIKDTNLTSQVNRYEYNYLNLSTTKYLYDNIYGTIGISERRYEMWLLKHFICGAVAERLRHRSREQKVPISSTGSDISVEVTSQC